MRGVSANGLRWCCRAASCPIGRRSDRMFDRCRPKPMSCLPELVRATMQAMRLRRLGWLLLLLACPSPSTSRDGGVDGGAEDVEPELRRLVARFGSSGEANDVNPYLRQLRAGLRSGRLSLDRAVFARCIDGKGGFSPPLFTGACEGLFRPLTSPGEPCSFDGECVRGECRSIDGGCASVCREFAPEGASCVTSTCEPSLGCLSGLCTRPPVPQPGGPCPCAGSLWCDGATCRERGGDGAPCSSDEACAFGRCLSTGRCGVLPAGATCQHSSYCSATTACVLDAGTREVLATFFTLPGVCTPPALHTPCESFEPRCGPGLVCLETRWLLSCAAAVSPNEACVWDGECSPGHRCLGGRCRLKVAPGDSCADPSTACMQGAVCVSGRCSRRPRPGEPCTSTCLGGECRAGRCVADGGALFTEVCPLGDGAARDDFFGANEEPSEPRPCVPTGPPSVVRPLTAEEARCVLPSPECQGCHYASGCPELRPRFGPPPPFNPNLGDLVRNCLDGG